MPGAAPSGRRVSHETRLLILTIVVSALVLLLLARLRFPETPPVVTTTQPLERLASRATYEDLATSIARLEEAIAPNLVTLRVSGAGDVSPRQLSDVLARPPGEAVEFRHVPALRISESTGIAAIPPGTVVSGIIGRLEEGASASVIGLDPVRRLALVRLPEAPARTIRQLALADLRTPTYVVAVEGTRAGVTLRPVFLGRAERFGSARFPRALLPLGGAVVTTGALMFTLQGEFLGCAVVEDGTLAIVGANDVLEIVDRLRTSAPVPVDPGISVQPLTAALAMATGVPHGVVVASVFENGPAAGVLEPGDVVTQIGGDLVDAPDTLLLQLSARLAQGAVQITFARGRVVQTARLAPGDGRSDAGAASRGLSLQPGSGRARVSDIERGSPWDAAGLQPGDEILRIGDTTAPTPAAVRQAIAEADAGAHVMLVIRRGTEQRVLAVSVPAEQDARGR